MNELVKDGQLAARFARMTEFVGEADWAEVESRAHALAARSDVVQVRAPRFSSRKFALVGVAALLAVAAPAFGLPQRVVKLFSAAEPAPPRTELLFSTLDRGAPPGLETGVIARTARKAFEVELPEGVRGTLWVAPTAKGGHCELLQLIGADGRPRGTSGPGCDDRANATGVGLTVPGPITPRGIDLGPVVVDGHTTLADASSAIIRFEDKTETVIPLVWISDPIDAGFFVYGVPPANWKRGRLPTHLQYVDMEGNAVGEQHSIALGQFLDRASEDPFPPHDHPCRVAQTCPSDDGSYRWGQERWLCIKATAYTPSFRFTDKIRYGGLTYLCKR